MGKRLSLYKLEWIGIDMNTPPLYYDPLYSDIHNEIVLVKFIMPFLAIASRR